jgi:formyltetrahydrofolate-dependent phosphoribosylglycinamide formyltransferase
MKVAVFASGGGSNLEALLNACHRSGPARVALVVSNRADSGAVAKARTAHIATSIVGDPRDGAAIVRALDEAGTDLVVLAGYLKLIPPSVVAAYRGRMINIHPSLLPAFGGEGMYGKRVHQAVLARGATVSGATVHLVDEEFDRGRIVAQWPVPVMADDTPETLAQRVLAVEHQLLPAVVLTAAHRGRVEALRVSAPDFAFKNAAAADLTEVWRGLASPIE